MLSGFGDSTWIDQFVFVENGSSISRIQKINPMENPAEIPGIN
jgi:hypothetical protein